MFFVFIGALLLIVLAAGALEFLWKMRSLRADNASRASSLTADRYRPMRRLLSQDDLAFIPADSRLQRHSGPNGVSCFAATFAA